MTFFFVIVFALSLKQKLVLGICAVFISGLTLISTEQNSGSIQVVGFAERIEKTVVQLNSADYPRFRQFRDSFFVGVTNPFTGVGLGGYYNFAKEKGYSEHVRVPEAALNHVIAEFGLFFFILFIFLLAFLFHKLQKTKKSKLRDYQKAIFLGTLVLFLFNEMHVQSSLWILLMFYFFHSKRVLKEEEF